MRTSFDDLASTPIADIDAVHKPFADRVMIRVASLPIVIIAVLMAHSTSFGRLIQQTTFGMVFHEFGHAVTAWFTGTPAVPALFVTLSANERHMWALTIPLGLSGFSMWRGWKCNLPFWLATGSACVPLILGIGFFVTESERPTLISWGGIGGEFILGALLIVASAHRLSTNPRKDDKARIVCLVVGVAVLVPAFVRWRHIAAGTEAFPMGSLIYGDTDGDMNRVLAAGHTNHGIAQGYLRCALICFLGVFVNWAATSTLSARRMLQSKPFDAPK